MLTEIGVVLLPFLLLVQGYNFTYESVFTIGTPPKGTKYSSGVLDSNNRLYIFGGSNNTFATNNLSIFNTNTYTWESSTPQPITARYGHCAVLLKQETLMILFGGAIGNATGAFRVNEIKIFHFWNNTWTSPDPMGTLPSARSLPAAAPFGEDSMIIFGGRGNGGPLNDLWLYNVTNNSWSKLVPTGVTPQARSTSTAVITRQKIMVIFGGWNPLTSQRFNDVAFYDPFQNTWLPVPPINGSATPRDSHVSVLTSTNQMIVFGGNDDRNLPLLNVEVLDLNTYTWTAITPNGPVPLPRESAIGFLVSINSLLIYGGKDEKFANFIKIAVQNDAHVSTPVSTMPERSTIEVGSPITQEKSKKNNKESTIIAVGASIGGILLGICVALAVLIITRKKGQKSVDNEVDLSSSNSTSDDSTYAPIPRKTIDVTKPSLKKDLFESEITWDEVNVEECIGNGSFGVVYRGEWRFQKIAVKKIIGEFSDYQLQNFREEAHLMSKLRPHENVVQFIGVCLRPLGIVVKFYEIGSLDSYIEKHQLDVRTVLQIMKDIAAGVGHLHQENIVHRDLASRNILLQQTPSGIRAIVSDFGFARAVNNTNEGTTKTNIGPIRWMAPESLLHNSYSQKTDSWAFGVIFWEILTRREPWKGVDNIKVILAVTNGELLEIPHGTPEEIKGLILSCWAFEAAIRPDMKKIYQTLEQIIKGTPL